MKGETVLIIGCGDLGLRTGYLLQQAGWQVHGVRRDPSRLPSVFTGHVADYTRPGSLKFLAGLRPDFVLATFNPPDRSTSGYVRGFQQAMGNLLAGLGEHRPRHLLMTSSTRVFAESAGGWVDESSALPNTDPWARAIIAAEGQLLSSGLSASVIRFGGIYGIPGGRLLSRIRRGELCPASPISFTNRIHRDDCGGFLAHLLRKAAAGDALRQVYIGVDNRPAPRYEVESWLAGELGMTGDTVASQVVEPTRHNRAGHKRCHNRALRESGYQLLYPDYRVGYRALLRSL